MSPGDPRADLARPLVLVTGKGGAGKSTIAWILAAAAARRGKRTLLLRVSIDPGLIDPAMPAPPGPRVTVQSVDGRGSLDEYLGTVLPAPIARRVAGSRIYRRFVAAAPGLRELMLLGKLAYEGRSEAWDTVIVDAPATGHALQMFRMPAAAVVTFGGLVRGEADRVMAQLRDPARTVIVPVTLAEELAVNETLELCAALGELELPIGPIVVNRVHRAPIAAADLLRPAHASALALAALQAGLEEAGWAALNERQIERLRAQTSRRLIRVPFVAAEELGLRELERLRAAFEEQMGAGRS
jgi:anion-transporting  ArsA/GET3 family ATPase